MGTCCMNPYKVKGSECQYYSGSSLIFYLKMAEPIQCIGMCILNKLVNCIDNSNAYIAIVIGTMVSSVQGP